MSSRWIRPLHVAVLLVSVTEVGQAQARIQRGIPHEDSTRVTLALVVGGQHIDGANKGRCVHAPVASIYNTVAAMWSLDYQPAPGRSINLTVWRPASGDSTPQITFSVYSGGKSERIATVKATKMEGKGTVQVTRKGAGGRFDIEGTTSGGAAVKGFIECEKFAAPVAAGGN